jgi:hypothetical protein
VSVDVSTTRWLSVFAVLLAVAPGVAGAQEASATLVGVVRDSAGVPVARAEVILRQATTEMRRTIADEQGRFVLSGVAPGTYLAWIRRMGFVSAEYNWAAVGGKRDSIAVTLRTIAQGLSPVVVRVREDRDMKGSAELLGLVVDTAGNPVAEANVQLVGSDRAGETRENGGFLFRPLPAGPYVVRVRKLGYTPQSVTVQLREGDERELVVRLHPLPQTLDAVHVIAASGFDSRAERALKDLDTRLRWRAGRDLVMGPAELRRFEGNNLAWLSNATGMFMQERLRRGPTSINPRGNSGQIGSRQIEAEGDACIVEDGVRFVHRPLSSYHVSDIELLEVYDRYGDETGTLAELMTGVCMRAPDGKHRLWYVVWLKGRDR